MDLDLIENVIMLIAAITGLLLTLYKYLKIPKRGWFYISVFFMMHFLSDYYWTIYTLVIGDNPDVSAFMAYFGWNVGYAVLLVAVLNMRLPEVKGYFHPLMLIPIPINFIQFLIYIPYGGLINNIWEGGLATAIACTCMQSLLYWYTHRKDGFSFPWTHGAGLLFITFEYGMWTSSCFDWPFLPFSMYYIFALCESVVLVLISRAISKDYENRGLLNYEKSALEAKLQRYLQIIVSSIVLFGSIGGYNVALLMKRAFPEGGGDKNIYGSIAITLFGISILLVSLIFIVIVMTAMKYKRDEDPAKHNSAIGKMRSRFDFAFTILITLGLMIFSVIYTSRLFYSVSVDGLIEDGESKAGSIATDLENYVGVARSVLWVTADTVELMVKNGLSNEEILDYIVRQTQNQSEQFDENFTGLYAYIDGEYMDGSGWIPPDDYNVEVRDWYKSAVDAKGETIIVSPYVDAQTHSVVLTICKLLDDGGKEGDYHKRQVVALDLVVNHVQEITDNINISGKGYGMVVGSDGMIISHHDHENNGQNIIDKYGEDLFNLISGADNASVEASFEGEAYTLFIHDVIGQWYVVIVVSDAELYKEVYSQLAVNIVVSLIIFVLISFFYYLSYKTEQINSIKVEELNRNRQKQEYEAQVLMLEKQSADEANKAKSRFLADMSHEIRTPINAILGMNEMVLRQARDKSIVNYSRNIRISGNNLLQIINSILDFSKIEDGKMEIIPVPYSLGKEIIYLESSIRERAEGKGLEFIVDVDPSLPKMLYGDDARVNQIIMNLLTNAVKYTHEGSVRFSVSSRKIEGDNILLYVEVRDTGIGIKESDMGKLFESFERLDQVKNRNIEGTGLGMPITTSLLKLMGSELKVESVYGEGSVFSFELWQKIEDAAPLGDYTTAVVDVAEDFEEEDYLYAPDARILVVDDTRMNLLVVTSLLERTGIAIDTAISGKDAIALADKNRYDLIILDQRMPVMDGTQTLAAIRSLENHMNLETPVVCFTADAIRGAKERILADGFQDYLSKPVKGIDLENMIRKYLPAEFIKSPPIIDENDEAVIEFARSTSMVEKLSEAGCDTENAMDFCGGEEEFYREILEDYLNSADERKEKIAEAYKAKDWKNYSIYIHALKSSSRTIGFNRLSEFAKELEAAATANDEDEINRQHDTVMAMFDEVLAVIHDCCYDDAASDKLR